MRKALFLIIAFTLLCNCSVGQTLSEAEIEKVAKQINQKVKGFDSGNGPVARGCTAIGRTLIYQYDVPDYWQAPENIKEDLIANLKTSGAAKFYFLNDINVDYFYYKGNVLVKKVSIKSIELSIYNTDLGEYLSTKDHPKAKGVSLSIKVPIGWEVKEGDRPNVVKKLVKDGNIFMILIKENMTFFSRNQYKELTQTEEFMSQFVQESISSFKDGHVLNKDIVTIGTHPAIHITAKGTMERTGIVMPVVMDTWFIFYEDKFILLQAMGLDNPEYRALQQLYHLVTNSVFFPDQYE